MSRQLSPWCATQLRTQSLRHSHHRRCIFLLPTWSLLWFQNLILWVLTAPVWFDLTYHEEYGALGNNPTGEHNTEDENEGNDLKQIHSKPITSNLLFYPENLGSSVSPFVLCLTAGVCLGRSRLGGVPTVPTLGLHITLLAESNGCQ